MFNGIKRTRNFQVNFNRSDAKLSDTFKSSGRETRDTTHKQQNRSGKLDLSDHKKQHFIQILINNKTIAEGWGKNIKSAEQKISKIAYNSVC